MNGADQVTTSAEEVTGWKSIEILAFVPGVAVLFLSLLYVIGAVAISGQISASGVNRSAAFSYYSIETVLMRGVGSIASPTGLIYVIGGAFVALVTGFPRKPRRRQTPAQPKQENKDRTWILSFNILALLCAMALPVIAIFVDRAAISITLVVYAIFFVEYLFDTFGAFKPRYLPLSLWATASIVGLTSASYIHPPPAPDAVLELKSGENLRASLIASPGESWVVAQDETLVVINPGDVNKATISSVERPINREPLIRFP